MTKRNGRNGNGQSLNDIRLEDFPENEELASSYIDWEYAEGDDDGTVVMTKNDFLAEEDFIKKSLEMIEDEDSSGFAPSDAEDTIAGLDFFDLPGSGNKKGYDDDLDRFNSLDDFTLEEPASAADDIAVEEIRKVPEELTSSAPADGAEDFTLKLDPSYFDKTEDELKLEHEAVKAEEKIKKTIPETSIPFREHQKYEYNEVKEPRIITSVDDIEDEAFEEVPDWQAGVELDTAPLAAEKPQTRRSDLAKKTDKNQSSKGNASVAKLFASEETKEEKTSGRSSMKSKGQLSKKSQSSRSSKTAPAETRKLRDIKNTREKTQKVKEEPLELDEIYELDEDYAAHKSGSAAATISRSRSKDSISRSSSSDRQSRKSSSSSKSRSKSANKGKKVQSKPKPIGLKIAKFFIFLLLWIAVVIVCYKGYQLAYDVFYDVAVDPEDLSKIEVTLTGKESNDEAGELLLSNGLIDDMKIFKLRCRIYEPDYKSGTFKLSRSYNTEKILNILSGYNYSTGTMEEEESEAAGDEADPSEGEDGEDDYGEDREDEEWQEG